MIWKNWPYWVKGGVSTVCVVCLAYLIAIAKPFAETPKGMLSLGPSLNDYLSGLVMWPGAMFSRQAYWEYVGTFELTAEFALIATVSILFYFLFGVVVSMVIKNLSNRT